MKLNTDKFQYIVFGKYQNLGTTCITIDKRQFN